jgi:hypothetical protein
MKSFSHVTTISKATPKLEQVNLRKPKMLSSAIPFVNRNGHVIRLSRSMTIRELIKMGVVEIHLAKPGTPLLDGEWRADTSL